MPCLILYAVGERGISTLWCFGRKGVHHREHGEYRGVSEKGKRRFTAKTLQFATGDGTFGDGHLALLLCEDDLIGLVGSEW